MFILRYQTEIFFMNCPQGTLFHEFGFIGISQPLVLLIAREKCVIESRSKKYMYRDPDLTKDNKYYLQHLGF